MVGLEGGISLGSAKDSASFASVYGQKDRKQGEGLYE